MSNLIIKGERVKFKELDYAWLSQGLTVIADGYLADGTRVHVVQELGFKGMLISNALIFSGAWVRDCLVLQPYKLGTDLVTIVIDGWSRGFDVQQTIDEAFVMGYDVDEERIKAQWGLLTAYSMDESEGVPVKNSFDEFCETLATEYA